jgi:hypothetical protein
MFDDDFCWLAHVNHGSTHSFAGTLTAPALSRRRFSQLRFQGAATVIDAVRKVDDSTQSHGKTDTAFDCSASECDRCACAERWIRSGTSCRARISAKLMAEHGS